MLITFLMGFVTFFLFVVSFKHYQNKIERNNISNSIIKNIKGYIVNNKYKISDLKDIKNVRFLHQIITDNINPKNEYRFIVRSGTKVYHVDIEVRKENNDYISKYKSYFLLEKEVGVYFFYSKYVLNTLLGTSFLSIKTVKFIVLISGISTLVINFVLLIWFFDTFNALPCWLSILLNGEC